MTTSTRGVGSSCATWVEARGRDRVDRWPSIGTCITTPTDRSTKIATTLVNRNHNLGTIDAWQGTYRTKTASSLYKLSRATRDAFEKRFQEEALTRVV